MTGETAAFMAATDIAGDWLANYKHDSPGEEYRNDAARLLATLHSHGLITFPEGD